MELDEGWMSHSADEGGRGGWAPPEFEARAAQLLSELRAELARLRREGIPAGHTWSAVLVPLAWLTLPAYNRRLLRPGMLAEGVDLRPLRRLEARWRRRGVRGPECLVGWIQGQAGDRGRPARGIVPFSYLDAAWQEIIFGDGRSDRSCTWRCAVR